ncbi:MAG TPA: lipoyl(octanoyl) transferase LipB, partial [Anaerolineales bacterium]|nr:lipoyl(octanoyl) transferase LipB [Anaerolineales bacterium]
MPLHIIGMNIEILDLGLIDYEQAWKLQDEYAGEIAKGLRPPTLLLLEHPHVYTFGRKGNASNLLWNENQLKEKGIATYWVDRGGDVTYHGPGQLVGYPLIPLGRLNQDNRLPEADYVGYIRKLETMLIGVLMNYGIASGQRPGKTGVWIQADVHSRCIHCKPEDKQKPAKIAAIGVKVDVNGVTRHGFALNVNPDMDYWNGIIP